MPSSMKILKAFANISIIALLVCQGCVLTLAQENSTKILENERVVVWRIGADTNGLSPARQLRFPAVLISLVDGAVRFISANDTSTNRPNSGPISLHRSKRQEALYGPSLGKAQSKSSIMIAFSFGISPGRRGRKPIYIFTTKMSSSCTSVPERFGRYRSRASQQRSRDRSAKRALRPAAVRM
jgi:hypothetical protein